MIQQGEIKPEDKIDKKRGISIPILLTSIGMVFSLILAIWFYVGREEAQEKKIETEKKLEQAIVAKRVVEENLKETITNSEKLTEEVKALEEEIIKVKQQASAASQEKEQLAQKIKVDQQKIKEISDLLDSEKREKMVLAEELASLRSEQSQTKKQVTRLEEEKEKLLAQLSSQPTTEKQPQTPETPVDLGQIHVGDRGIPNLTTAVVATGGLDAQQLPGKIGRILVVNDEFNFVVVSFGKNDGLRGGEFLNIYRDGKPIGKVQIEKLYDAISAASILEEKRGFYKEGDTVKL